MQEKTVIFGQKEAANLERRYELDRKMRAEKQEESKVVLKPCPFCGAPAQLKEISDRWAVECTKHCAGTRIFNDKQKPIEAWNRRI